MFSIDQLCANSNNPVDLENYLKNNIVEISYFFDKEYNSLKQYRWEVEDCVIENENSINNLNFSKFYNSLFALTLLEFSERYRLPASFEILYNISINNDLKVGYRQKASKIFLLGTNLHTDHINNFFEIVTNLQTAYEIEEDNEINVLVTFGNYFLNAVLDTIEVDIEITKSIIQKIKEETNNYSFLLFDFINSIVDITPNATRQYSDKIQLLIEQLLLKQKPSIPVSIDFIIEHGTKYADKIKNIPSNFNSIREVSMEIFNSYTGEKKSKLRNELLRGVKIIDKKEQLYAYTTLFGKKHQKKLIYAFKQLQILQNGYNLIDWACGQGLASMVFFDYYGIEDVSSVILNEPSELALKRASLHLHKYNSSLKIETINKAIEQISFQDISLNNKLSNIHLFSNILDIKIDLVHLTTIIEHGCKDDNYFVCVSPYIDEIRKNRIDLFVNYFQNKYSDSFELIKSINIKNDDPTMIIRIFKVHIQ